MINHLVPKSRWGRRPPGVHISLSTQQLPHQCLLFLCFLLLLGPALLPVCASQPVHQHYHQRPAPAHLTPLRVHPLTSLIPVATNAVAVATAAVPSVNSKPTFLLNAANFTSNTGWIPSKYLTITKGVGTSEVVPVGNLRDPKILPILPVISSPLINGKL